MKKTNLFYLGIVSFTLFMSSCGGGSQTEASAIDSTAVAAPVEEVLSVNLDSSKVMWKGEMLGMYSHEGTVKLTEAAVTLTGGKVSAGSFTIDMKSIVPTDQNYDAKKGHTSDKLVQHLSAADFFMVDSFPTSNFVVVGNDGASTVNGTLTLRGKSGDQTVTDVVVSNEGNVYKISGNLKVNRKNFNVMYSNPAKEMVLSDDIILNVSLYATK